MPSKMPLRYLRLFKDLFKIKLKFFGGEPPTLQFFEVFWTSKGEKIFFFQKWPKCGLVLEKTRKKVFNFSGNRGGGWTNPLELTQAKSNPIQNQELKKRDLKSFRVSFKVSLSESSNESCPIEGLVNVFIQKMFFINCKVPVVALIFAHIICRTIRWKVVVNRKTTFLISLK